MSGARIVGVVLAGGASRRMGGRPKALMELEGATLLARSVVRLRPQVDAVLVNANDPDPIYREAADGLAADAFEDRRGPLAGVLAAMEWARTNRPDALAVASVAVDTPDFPTDLVARLAEGRSATAIALATVDDRPQPTFGVWPVELADDLRRFLLESDTYKVLAFTARHETAMVAFSDVEAFANINTPDDLDERRGRSRP